MGGAILEVGGDVSEPHVPIRNKNVHQIPAFCCCSPSLGDLFIDLSVKLRVNDFVAKIPTGFTAVK